MTSITQAIFISFNLSISHNLVEAHT